MIQSIAPAEAIALNRVQRSEDGASATDFIGRRGVVSDDGLAFLVENPPGFVTPAHFHDVNQFQLFIRGSARIGRHRVVPGTLHYAEAGTPYGPIVPDADGLAYFTLRQAAPGGYYVMPGARHLMNRETGRTFLADCALDPRVAKRLLFGRPDTDDAPAAYELAAAAGAALPRLDIAHDGAFIVVMAGTLLLEGRAHPAQSCIWIGPGDAMPAMVAGGAGAHAALMLFPRRSRGA